MQIKINTKDFANALNIGGSMAGRAKGFPILDYAEVKINGDNSCTILSYDGEIAIFKKAKIEYSGEAQPFCVNPKDLINILKNIKDEYSYLNIENGNCEVNHNNGKISIPYLGIEDFPVIERESDSVSIHVESSELYDEITNTTPFIVDDTLRPALSGINFAVKGESLQLSATDSHVLYCNNIHVTNPNNEEVEAIVSIRAIRGILGVINRTEKTKISFGQNNICFISDGAMLLCRRIVGKFPNVQSVIPTSNKVILELSREEFTCAINRAILASNNATQCLKFTIGDNALTVSSEDTADNKRCEEKCVCNISSADGNEVEKFTFAVKGTNLLTCIGAIDNDNIMLLLKDNRSAILLKDSNNENKSVLTMPLAV